MDAALRGAVQMQSDLTRLLNTVPGVSLRGNEPYINVFIEMESPPPSLGSYNVQLVSRAGSIYLARLPVANLEAVASLPGVLRMEGDARVESFLDVSVPAIGADRVWNSSEFGNPKGDGVILGMVDTGISLDHRDFDELGPTGESRIEFVWDQSDGTGPAPEEPCLDFSMDPPVPVPCGGTECSPASEECAQEDLNGHGTLVMGAMAGNGQAGCPSESQDPCIGVAWEGEMIVVKHDLLLASEVIQGVDYIFKKADALGKPAVVNLSLGWYTGSRDGNSLLERNLSNLVEGEGRILVTSAGNANLEMAHARIEINGMRRTLFLDCTPQQTDAVLVYGWYDAPSNGSVEVRAVSFQDQASTDWVPFGGQDEEDSNRGRMSVAHLETSGDAIGFMVRLDSGSNRLLPGQWHIEARNPETGALGTTVDLWLDRTFLVGSSAASPCPKPARFIKNHQERESTIAPPCTADNVICVGSFNTKCIEAGGEDFCSGCSIDYEGFSPPIENCVEDLPEEEDDLSSFSSQGPARDGDTVSNRRRPWLTAPGNAILTPDNRGAETYSWAGGTSLSSPHVAGTVALMLDANPTLTAGTVLDVLRNTARPVDGISGWDPGWGYGRVDAFAAVEQVAAQIPPPPPEEPHGLGGDDDLCFIATAAFGGVHAPEVILLREMRDRSLLKTSWGRALVRFYYEWSPPVASWLKEHALCAGVVRVALSPAVGWSEMAYRSSPAERAILFVVGLSLVGAVCYSSVRRRTR
jgi:subtilisin family serine protease